MGRKITTELFMNYFKRKSTVISLVFLNVLLLIHLYAISHVLPNTFLDDQNISGKSYRILIDDLNNFNNSPVNIKIGNRHYRILPKDIGVSINPDISINEVFKPNHTWFPKTAIWFFSSLFHKRIISSDISFSSDFTKFVTTTKFDTSINDNEIVIDNENKKFTIPPQNRRFIINSVDFKRKIASAIGKNNYIIEPKLDNMSSAKELIITNINDRLNNVFQNSLSVNLISNSQKNTVYLTPEEIKSVVELNYDKNYDQPEFQIDRDRLITLVKSRTLAAKGIAQGQTISPMTLQGELLTAVSNRYNGQIDDEIDISLNGGPNSTGDIADKYIEIDISQQKMYLFESKNVRKIYPISTGLYYPTPTGLFKILNKAPNAYSGIYHVWMPFWMAFWYSPEINAYFGIHELPYWVTDNGTKIQRPRERIGNPSTGGCVAMDIGDAKELYNWTEVGFPVVIYQ